jgi:hypothetical protein
MTNVLSKGLNFCVNPKKFNVTELKVDLRKFERKLKWKEFFTDKKETEPNNWQPDIFPIEKTSLPAKSSKNLNNFITGIRSELTGTEFNSTRSNLTKDEEEALKTFNSNHTKETFEMTDAYNCSTKGIMYLTSCTHCGKQYVGQTGRKLKDRIKEHLNNMYHKKEVTGLHYTLPGHSHWNFKVQIIEKVTPNTPNYRLEREDFWKKKLATKTPFGLNKND